MKTIICSVHVGLLRIPTTVAIARCGQSCDSNTSTNSLMAIGASRCRRRPINGNNEANKL